MIKPIWGLLIDVFPIRGYRRRPYFNPPPRTENKNISQVLQPKKSIENQLTSVSSNSWQKTQKQNIYIWTQYRSEDEAESPPPPLQSSKKLLKTTNQENPIEAILARHTHIAHTRYLPPVQWDSTAYTINPMDYHTAIDQSHLIERTHSSVLAHEYLDPTSPIVPPYQTVLPMKSDEGGLGPPMIL
uniref:Uncharacterized protein n=1 Tax=Nelumbo nucifera TaxID=4432 RepID=A0A822YIZ7_NELNU|nr:TPA_asm: hypothetical protein HUJ06_009786 [Nelumbo nucifera]